MDSLLTIVGIVGDLLAGAIEALTGWRPDERAKSALDWIGTLTGAFLGVVGVWALVRKGGQATTAEVREVEKKVEQTATRVDIEALRQELQQALRAREAAPLAGSMEVAPQPGQGDGLARDLNAAIDTLVAAGKADALKDKTGEDALAALDGLIAERQRVRERVTKDEAALWRQKGALAFLHDTQTALAAYRRATELDPADADGWNQLGQLYYRTGDQDDAMAAWERVLALGNRSADQATIAVATGNLGIVYMTRGDLDRAEEMYRKALALDDALGRKEGMANQYGNLGLLEAQRGNIPAAEDMYRKSLALNEALGRKEGMANQYGNLGLFEAQSGNIAAACAHWTRARDLFRALGAPHMVEKVEGQMRDAGCGGV